MVDGNECWNVVKLGAVTQLGQKYKSVFQLCIRYCPQIVHCFAMKGEGFCMCMQSMPGVVPYKFGIDF